MDNGVPIPFVADPNNPDISYQLGFALSASVRAEIEDFEPSIIHITCPDCTALHLIQYARRKEIPLMGTYHSNIPEYMEHYPGLSWLKHILGAFFRHQYNFLQALYVPTPFIQKHLIDTYHMDSATSLGIWGRGVDIDKFNPGHRSFKYRHSLGIADDTVVLCWVGRLVPEKRPDIFANVVRRLHARNLNFHALVIGAGPNEDDVKYLPNTTFCGWMNADQLSVAYASCDAFLFPSAVETFGNVTLEAASSGLPVVVEAGCSGHLVRKGDLSNGFACPEGNENAFFQATLELVVNDKLRASCSRNGRRLAESLEKRTVVRAMLDNYSHVTDQFYTEYGGRHAHRDDVYRKPDSFVGGNTPRPLLLVMVEYLFIVLFQVIWNMTSMFMYMHETFSTLGGVSTNFSSEETTVAATASHSSGSTSTSTNTSDRQHPSHSQKGTIVELTDIEIGGEEAGGLLANSSSLASEEDETDSRASLPQQQEGDETAPLLGDSRVSHALAKGFIRVMEFQCRMESHLRNACSRSCCHPAGMRVQLKRKNSSFALPDLGGGCRPEEAIELTVTSMVGSGSSSVEGQLRQRDVVMEGVI